MDESYKGLDLGDGHTQSPSLRITGSSHIKHSFTVNYLIRNCGLSPESARSASKHVKFETPDKPDSVLAVFKTHGFSSRQISSLVKKLLALLISKPEKKILPKLEFLRSKGFSSDDVVGVVGACPVYLRRSLKNHIVPSFSLLKDLLDSDEKTVLAVKRYQYLLYNDVEASMLPRIKILHDNGVSELNIARLIFYWPGIFFSKINNFRKNIEALRKIGFDPSKSWFCFVFGAIKSMNTPTWGRKVNLLKSWGLSEEEIIEEFKKNPIIMTLSKEKLKKSMDIFVDKLGWERSFLRSTLLLLTFSIERRLLPRASVLQFLVSKGLLKKDYRSISFFKYSETEFLQKVICRYTAYKELLELYDQKLEFSVV